MRPYGRGPSGAASNIGGSRDLVLWGQAPRIRSGPLLAGRSAQTVRLSISNVNSGAPLYSRSLNGGRVRSKSM